MDNSNKKTFIIAIITAALAVFGAALLTLGRFFEFDPQFGYFKNGSVYSVGLYAVLALGAIVGLYFWISSRHIQSRDRNLPYSGVISAFAVLCSVAMLTSTVYEMIDVLGIVNDGHVTVTYISWALSVFAAVSLFLTAFSMNGEPMALPCLLSFSPPLYFASRVLVDYFDRGVAVNSPIKTLSQMTLIFFMLMLTAESGIFLGRGKIYPRYLFTLTVSTVFGGAVGFGGIAAYFLSSKIPIDLPQLFLYSVFALYSAARLLSIPEYEVLVESDADIGNADDETAADADDADGIGGDE